ncbi:hypothetical protein [Croceicoccus sp. BE223]|uniref:hypothetical protein n=1 Tax=Croceicoccus sp. BE223 TaxID=2817716 RepID=UPI0028592113|nr:hypothetical protein [Croceicoccus sp. BE223]MDR7101498.1 hypothetical protein [Croceicoccus sp. BE223]
MWEGGAAQFVIPALTQYAEAGDMARWIATARPGEVLVYATGPMLGDHAAKRLALRWHGEGRVHLFQRRAERAHCFEYCARARAPSPGEGANDGGRPAGGRQVAGSPPRDDVWRESRDGRVYALLFRDVAAGRCCPSNGEIAERLDLDDRYAAKNALTRLKTMGLIRFEQAGRTRTRIVTIVATGQSSADISGEIEHG